MSRRPNTSQLLAMKAAAAVAAQDDEIEDLRGAELTAEPAPILAPAPSTRSSHTEAEETAATISTKSVGRPKGRRPVAARQTVYLDDARHAALARLAEDRGRSIHSLILEGIDHVIGKPVKAGWQ